MSLVGDDWEAPAGSVKRVCLGRCRKAFASRGGAVVCPTCLARSKRRSVGSESALDPLGADVGFRREARAVEGWSRYGKG